MSCSDVRSLNNVNIPLIFNFCALSSLVTQSLPFRTGIHARRPSSEMRTKVLHLATFSVFVLTSLAATLTEWRSRSIYQVLTDRFAWGNDSTPSACAVVDGLYCGGSWTGIKNRLDYIQEMSFDAIWISPIVAQLPQRTGDGEAYTAYWAQDLYALNPHFGTREDFISLINEVHNRGMYLMLDVVVNHLGFAGEPQNVDYSILNPFNDEKYFHHYCTITNPDNQTNVEVCWLGDEIVPLADLRTEDQDVQDMFSEWISGMVKNYSIDGLRIDTSINVNPSFFTDFVKSAGVFATGEIMEGDCPLACEWEKTIGSILNYIVYYPLIRAFQDAQGSINDLVETINAVKSICGDPTAFGTFSENHDVERFASYTPDLSLAKNMITYTIMADGIPIIYQGQEQQMTGSIDPYFNRAPLWEAGYNTSAPLYQHIATLNKFRQHVFATSTNYSLYMSEVIYQDYHSLGLRKGFNGSQVITVLNNNGVDTDDFILDVEGSDYPPGTQLTEILTCTNLTINTAGCLHVPMGEGKPKVMYPTDHLYNSSLCDMPDKAPEGVMRTTSTSYSTTVNGRPTQVSTTTEVPATTTNAAGSLVSIAESTGSHKGTASSVRANTRTMLATAWFAMMLVGFGLNL